jgi:hypothetical protein
MVTKQAESGLHLISIALNIVMDLFGSITGRPCTIVGERNRHRRYGLRDREILLVGDTILRILKTLSSEILR